MAIPAQNPATASYAFDSLLIRTLIYTGGDKFNLQLARYASANGLIQPGSIAMNIVTDTAANAALQSLIAQFLTLYSLTGPVTQVVVNGRVSGATPNGSVRVATAAGLKVIQDANAEAAANATFASIFSAFEAAIAAYNLGTKII